MGQEGGRKGAGKRRREIKGDGRGERLQEGIVCIKPWPGSPRRSKSEWFCTDRILPNIFLIIA